MYSELGYSVNTPSPLHIDNESAVSVAKNPEHHGRMKQLDMEYFWLRDVVNRGKIEVKHVWTKENPADLLTKALARAWVVEHRERMGLF